MKSEPMINEYPLSVLQSQRDVRFEIRVVHSLKGRVRLHIQGITRNQISALSSLASTIAGVSKTKHISGSDTILVVYNAQAVSEQHIFDILSDTLNKRDPAEWSNGWMVPAPTRWGGALASTSVLFMCLSRAFPFPAMAFGISLVTIRPMARTLEALSEGKISIDLLDIAATFAALVTRRPATAAFVIWMVGVGDLLLDISANSTRTYVIGNFIPENVNLCKPCSTS